MQSAPLDHLSLNFSQEFSEGDPLHEAQRNCIRLPEWQLILLVSDDCLAHVNLRNHQADRSVRADALLDEVLFRFASRSLAGPEALELFKQAEVLTNKLLKISQGVDALLSSAGEFPAHAAHPQKFLDASQYITSTTGGFVRLSNAVKSSTSRLRSLLYPTPVGEKSSALSALLKARCAPDSSADEVRSLSNAALAVKVMQMVQGNSLAKDRTIVYGTKTLKVFVPLMLNNLLAGANSPGSVDSLIEYVESVQGLCFSLERAHRQLQILQSQSLSP